MQASNTKRNDHYNLQRFIEAQKGVFETALAEIRNGKKQSHWMWFIFPQLQGLGFSETSKFYAIKDLGEADAYLEHPVLGIRLRSMCEELLRHKGRDAHRIFGSPDDVKLKSSMTLFSNVHTADPVFQTVLDTFFGGANDPNTLRLLKEQ